MWGFWLSPSARETDRAIMAGVNAPTGARVARKTEATPRPDGGGGRLELVRENGAIVPAPAPTLKQLRRHRARFGDEGVDEVRDAYADAPLPLAAFRTDAPPGRKTTPQMRETVLRFAPTHPVSAIAATLNVSERRVKQIIRQG
jgi:hypothetical protein